MFTITNRDFLDVLKPHPEVMKEALAYAQENWFKLMPDVDSEFLMAFVFWLDQPYDAVFWRDFRASEQREL